MQVVEVNDQLPSHAQGERAPAFFLLHFDNSSRLLWRGAWRAVC